MIRWLMRLLCRHIYVSTPHWLLDTSGQKIGKVGLLVCAKCGHCSLSGIHPLAERAQGLAMRSDNMPRPFAPEHGEEAASQLQRDIDALDWLVETFGGSDEQFAAWQRILARLTPDRERVARAIASHAWPDDEDVDRFWPTYLDAADAAINAMKETP